MPHMEEPRLRIRGNREDNGPVLIPEIADDEAGGLEDHGQIAFLMGYSMF